MESKSTKIKSPYERIIHDQVIHVQKEVFIPITMNTGTVNLYSQCSKVTFVFFHASYNCYTRI